MGVLDVEPRKEAEADRLGDERERAGNEGLRGDDGRGGRKDDHRHDEPLRRERKEELVAGDRAAAHHIGALSEIVEQERRIDDGEPGEADRQRAEMADVGVHRFAAGDDQHQRAEDQERFEEMRAAQKGQPMDRVEGGENFGIRRDRGRAECGDAREPDENDRPEHGADAGGAFELDGEERDEEPERDRDRRAGEARHGDPEALDRREHADRRRDHAVADQEARARHQRPEQHPRAAVGAVVQKAVEREHAALAVVLRAQDQDGVFDRDDERQRPDDERNGAERVLGRMRRRDAKNLVHRVEGRSADVAVDDAERAERQRPDAAVRRVIAGFLGGLAVMGTIGDERHEATGDIFAILQWEWATGNARAPRHLRPACLSPVHGRRWRRSRRTGGSGAAATASAKDGHGCAQGRVGISACPS